MLVNIIQNTISSFRSALAAAEVITTNLKMWLGFETSETLGREEVVNGDFATDSVWVKGTGWTITNGKASNDGDTGSNNLTQGSILTSNKSYQITIEVSDFVSGNVQVSAGGVPRGTMTANGTYTFNQVASGSNFYIVANSFLGSVDNVSVKELTQITPDKSSNNNVGELLTGKAIELDGVNDEIDFGTAQIPIKTISFWIKPLSVSNEGLFYLGLSGFPQFRQISITSGNIAATSYLTNFTPYVNNIQTSAVTQDVWQRVVLTFDEWTTTTLQIGKVYSSVYGHFAISDVQFYKETWSTDDIAYDYANPNKLAIDNPSTSLSVTNLKAYWAMSEGDGKLAYDSGTNLEEEEVVNGDFATDSDWNKQSNWTISGGQAVSNGSSGYIKQNNVVTNNKTYQIVFSAEVTSGSFRAVTTSDASTYTPYITVSDTYTFYMSPTSSLAGGFEFISYAFDGSITNVSVREVTPSDHGGLINGADYVDAQPRIPQLGMMNWSKGSNLLPYSEDFTEWVVNPSTSQVELAATEEAPYGQGDVYSILMQASDVAPYIRYTTDNTTLTSSTHSVWVKQAPTGSATHIRITNNNKSAFNTGTSQKIALTSSWQRLETTDGITGVRYTIIGATDVGGIQDPDCLGKALIYGAQLLEGSSAGVYRFTDGVATSNSTVIANPTIPTQDIFGNAVRDRLNSFNLDGSGYAEVADDADLDIGTGAFTMECWVKADFENTGSSQNIIFSLGGEYNDADSASIITESTKFSCKVSTKNLIADNNYTIGDWYHVCVTRDVSNLCTLYIDAEAQADTETTSASITNTSTKLIGRDSLTTRLYKNLISDVRLYKGKALSASEIENNYNAGLSAHTN